MDWRCARTPAHALTRLFYQLGRAPSSSAAFSFVPPGRPSQPAAPSTRRRFPTNYLHLRGAITPSTIRSPLHRSLFLSFATTPTVAVAVAIAAAASSSLPPPHLLLIVVLIILFAFAPLRVSQPALPLTGSRDIATIRRLARLRQIGGGEVEGEANPNERLRRANAAHGQRMGWAPRTRRNKSGNGSDYRLSNIDSTASATGDSDCRRLR